MVMFILVARVLIKHTMKKSAKVEEKSNHKAILKTLLSVAGVMFLFGLSWLFAAFTVKQAAYAFQILFILFNSTQGFFIFIFICVLSQEIRQDWLNLFTCGRYAKQKLASSRAGHSTTNSHSNTRSTAISSRGNQTLRRAVLGHQPDMELKSFEGTDNGSTKLLESESKLVEEDEELGSEVPPQVNARGRAAVTIKADVKKSYLPLNDDQEALVVPDQSALLSNSESQEDIAEVTNL